MNFTRLFILFSFSFFYLTSFGQASGLKSISEKELKQHLEFLSSDSLQGRSFGTEVPGLDIAANYLANEAKKMGLKPGNKNFSQPVEIVYSKPSITGSELIIKNKKGKTIFKTNSITGFFKGSEDLNFNGELVFAGFGFQSQETGYDDFEGLNIKDKIVVYSTGSPTSFLEEQKGLDAGYSSQLERLKWERVIDKGAKGIIIFPSPLDKENSLFENINSWLSRPGYALKSENPNLQENNIILAQSSLFDKTIGKGKLLKELKNRVGKSKTGKNLFNGQNAEIILSYDAEHFNGKNVIGIIEGTDPELKNECVVFMAHYDHFGVDENGDVYNGADDNGSGVVTLLEVAEAFTSLEQKPKRSIVFLWVTFEEIGMFGSEYYTKNPIFPMEKTVACINLDMVGRVYEKNDDVWNTSPKLVRDFETLFALSDGNTNWLEEISDEAFKKVGLIPDKSLPSQFLRSSDHYQFLANGVPILNYSTGYHADYHKVTDEISKINFEKMKKVAELCFLVGYEVANKD